MKQIEAKLKQRCNHYQTISLETRLQLINLIFEKGKTIRSAAEKCKIGFSSAKMILHIFRHEGRIEKKKKYDKQKQAFKYGMFNRTIIGIQSSSKESTKQEDESQQSSASTKMCFYKIIPIISGTNGSLN